MFCARMCRYRVIFSITTMSSNSSPCNSATLRQKCVLDSTYRSLASALLSVTASLTRFSDQLTTARRFSYTLPNGMEELLQGCARCRHRIFSLSLQCRVILQVLHPRRQGFLELLGLGPDWRRRLWSERGPSDNGCAAFLCNQNGNHTRDLSPAFLTVNAKLALVELCHGSETSNRKTGTH